MDRSMTNACTLYNQGIEYPPPPPLTKLYGSTQKKKNKGVVQSVFEHRFFIAFLITFNVDRAP